MINLECPETHWPRGPMDKASAYGAGDCRFESRRVIFMHVGWQSGSFYLLPVGCKSHICRCAGLTSSGRSEVKTWLAEERAEK